jgi:hypothetical protein
LYTDPNRFYWPDRGQGNMGKNVSVVQLKPASIMVGTTKEPNRFRSFDR